MTIAMTIATTIRTPHSTKARFELRFGSRRCAAGRGSLARRPARTRRARPIRCRTVAAAWPCRGVDDGGGVDVVGHRGCSTAPSSQINVRADPDSGGHRTRSGIAGTGAGAGRRRRRRGRRARAAPTTVASGPRPTSSRSSHAGSLIASTTRHEPSLALRRRLVGVALDHPLGRGREPQGDARVLGARAVHEVAGRRRRRATPGRSARRSARTARTRSTRKSRSPSARWHHAATYQAPNAWNTRHGSMTRVVISSRANE